MKTISCPRTITIAFMIIILFASILSAPVLLFMQTAIAAINEEENDVITNGIDIMTARDILI